MTERVGTHWDRPEMSARIFKVMLVQFEKEYGRARLERLWAERSLPLSLAYAEDLSNFVSLAFVDKLLDALAEASGDAGFLTRAARSFVTPEAMGFAYYLLRSVGAPLAVYRKTVELGSTYNKVGAFAVESFARDRITVTYSSTVPEGSTRFCELRKVNYAIFPNIWGLPDATVVETACQVHGAPACRYVVTWRNPVGKLGRWLVGGLGLAGGGLAVSLGQPWGALPLFGALGFLSGAVLDGRRLAKEQEELLSSQTTGLSSSLGELRKKADELYAANLELDQRVAARTYELEVALEQLRRLDHAKSEFFANVSHELRTPLTLVLAPVEDRLSTLPGGPERELLGGIRRNARRLLRFIDDLLDLSRIDAGQLRLDVVPVDATALAQQVVGVFAGAAEGRGVKLKVEGPLETHDLWGDPHRLESVLSNLVGNAFKFTPDGGRIDVVVQENHAELRVAVTDSGPGIPQAQWEQVFQRYYQVPDERRRGGVGIGLALARNLAELHGGRIELRSTEGKGSTFTLALPKGREHFPADVLERRRAQVDTRDGRRSTDAHSDHLGGLALSAPLQPAAPVDGRRGRVLVVEDNAELRALLSELLSPAYDVLTADDGVPGLALVKAERPDLVLSDVMMPGLSGTALCLAIKADPVLKHTPVVLLTARSGPEAALEGFAAGADEFVEKPFHPRVLMARVQAQLRLKSMGLQVAANARLAVVGTLAAGVGHEVRNPVNAVLNGVRVLRSRPSLDPSDQQLLDVVADAAQRIDRISEALLGHASPGDRGGARPIEVREGLEATLRLLEHRCAGVTVHRALGPGCVVAAAGELNQVFMNLLDNALRSKATTLWVSSEQDEQRVRVAVADDGPGIAPDVLPRIFDPFFTTREQGEGTGLGLYLSRQAVLRWGGQLSVAPREGGGTRFTVDLPREVR